MAAGIALIGFLLWQLGRQTPFTRYRTERMTGWNVGLMGTAVLAIIFIIIPLPFLDRTTLAYTPYPRLSLPGFDVFVGLNLLWLVYPAAVVLLKAESGGAVGKPAAAGAGRSDGKGCFR